ncbi:MAG: hypothetical protein U0003_04205 [Vampirovibrionales bacterium]
MSDAETTAREAWQDLQSVLETVKLEEAEHPSNLQTHIEAPLKPVCLPNTQQTLALFEKAQQAIEIVVDSMRLPEVYALAQQPDTAAFAAHCCKAFINVSPPLMTPLPPTVKIGR